jgi:hypothetical protein
MLIICCAHFAGFRSLVWGHRIFTVESERPKKHEDDNTITQKNIKKYSKHKQKFSVDIPPNFVEILPLVPNGRSMKKDAFEIHIADFTGFKRETDIEMFQKNKKDGIIVEYAELFELKGKKCLVENLEKSTLDISHCQDISILIAFRGKCYFVLMKNDQPFDLNDFKPFLDSIGIKNKKTSKNIEK